MSNTQEKYVKILQSELKIAMGCTEPAAAALAGAYARELLDDVPTVVQVYASRDIIKNVMGVGIPNSPYSGLDTAVLMGVFYGDPQYGLNILSHIEKTEQKEIVAIKKGNKIHIEMAHDVPSIYIKVVTMCEGKSASVTIADEHDNVIEKIKDDKVIFKKVYQQRESKSEAIFPTDWSIQGILNFIDHMETKDCLFMLDVAKMNIDIGEYSLKNPYGMSVGRTMMKDLPHGIQSKEDAFTYGAILASAASDARMAGCTLPVVINSGSGNQGITATIPTMIASQYLKKDQETTIKALCLSHLIAIYIAYYKGRLSALCGAFTAAIGTCCAYVYLLGGDNKQIENSIKIMIADLTGIICDGAKKTCALKIYSCIQSASICAKLAISDSMIGEESGILGQSSEQTISYLSQISHCGMENTDKTIVSIMVNKKSS